jgi:transposase
MTLSNADVEAARIGGEAGAGGKPGPRAGNAQRRVFSSAYKLRIVAEYDGLTEHGARGALLRREGLYQSHVEKWRRARDRGDLESREKLAKPGSRSAPGDGRVVLSENRRLQVENEQLKAELDRTRAVLEIVGKVHALCVSRTAGRSTFG